jgi:hypothetical protein
MSLLLRADWLRLRGRRDLWLLVAAAPLLMVATYVNQYLTAAAGLDTHRQVPITPDERARDLAAFAFPVNLSVVLSVSIIALVVIAAFAVVTVGEDFEFGTIRPALHWSRSRARYLAAKQISLLVPIAVIFGSGLLVAVVMPLLIGLSGVRLAGGSPGFLSVAGLLGARMLVSLVFGLLAILIVVLVRSPVRAALAMFLYVLAETTIVGMPVWTGGFAWLREIALTRATGALIAASEQASREVAGALPDAAFGTAPPGIVSLLIVVAWGIALTIAASVRLHRLDITE